MIEEIKNNKIRIGNIVKLKTYNVNHFHLVMTVEDMVGREVKCVFFNEQEKLCRYWFDLDELVGIVS